jgi:hypothetical protein
MRSVNADFSFDLHLSHNSADKLLVRRTAEHLRHDGLRMWFDEWLLKPGDSIPAKIEEGLKLSRVSVLGMSAGKNNIRSTVKHPVVTDIESKATITFTYYRRTLLR